MTQDFTAAQVVDLAIRTEQIGAELYQGLSERFSQERELRELFEGLSRDEVQHEGLFRGLHERIAPRFRDGTVSLDQQLYLRAMSSSEALSRPKSLTSDLDSIRTRDDALERALHFEKATLAYYQAVREVVGADDVLDWLIAVEKRHVVKVMQLLITGAKFRGLADDF